MFDQECCAGWFVVHYNGALGASYYAGATSNSADREVDPGLSINVPDRVVQAGGISVSLHKEEGSPSMSFFISEAFAEPAGAAAQQSPFGMLLPLVLFAGVFYFLLWRPQSKRNKAQKLLVQGLSKGDEVVVSGGMLGKLTKVVDDFVVVEVAANTEIRFQKNAVTATLPRGTIKDI
jgi:preprotein translocase subunit YajC